MLLQTPESARESDLEAIKTRAIYIVIVIHGHSLFFSRLSIYSDTEPRVPLRDPAPLLPVDSFEFETLASGYDIIRLSPWRFAPADCAVNLFDGTNSPLELIGASAN